MTTAEIEKRLAAIELDVATLKSQRPPADKPHPVEVLEAIHGSFVNDDAFQEATLLGRKWRETQRLGPRKPKVKRK